MYVRVCVWMGISTDIEDLQNLRLENRVTKFEKIQFSR